MLTTVFTDYHLIVFFKASPFAINHDDIGENISIYS